MQSKEGTTEIAYFEPQDKTGTVEVIDLETGKTIKEYQVTRKEYFNQENPESQTSEEQLSD